MSHRTALALVFSVALASAGCGTLENVKRPTFPPAENPGAPVCRLYGGVRGDWEVMSEYPWDRTESYLDYVTIPPLAGINLVFAAIGDTITLPYTAYEELRRAYGSPRAQSGFGPVVVMEGVPATAYETRWAPAPPAATKPPAASPTAPGLAQPGVPGTAGAARGPGSITSPR